MKTLIVVMSLFYGSLILTLSGCGTKEPAAVAQVSEKAPDPSVVTSCTKVNSTGQISHHFINVFGCKAAQSEINIQCPKAQGWYFDYVKDCSQHIDESLISCGCPDLVQN